ncbi:MAG: CRTAC1 family protein [Phycisphaerae bacterium]|nr:CRTAC1 family protein [Phycisphaerae bacterium]
MTESPLPTRPDDEATGEPIVYGDDAVIGRALFISAVGVVSVGAVAAAVWLLWPNTPPPTPPAPAEVTGPANVPSRQTPPDVALPFTRVTESAGIDFQRVDGADGRKLLPETMGGGVAIADFNGDGTLDVAFADGDAWPDAPAGARRGQGVALFVNDGTMHFSRVIDAALAVPGQLMGLAAADVDGDGRVDLLATGVHGVRLLRNTTSDSVPAQADGALAPKQPTFADVTAATGLGADLGWSSSAGFADIDGDGDLDLVVLHYVEWSPDIDARVDFRLAGVGRAYGPPTGFPGAHVSLYEQVSPMQFVDRTQARGMSVKAPATEAAVAKALGLAIDDLDDDGDLDVLVANDQVRKFLFVNDGTGNFTEVGIDRGFAYDRVGAVTGAMGIDVARLHNTESPFVAIGNFANEPTGLYCARDRSLHFSDDSIAEGISASTRPFLTFGLLFADLNLDGRADLVQANGHIEEQIALAQRNQSYRQRTQAFVNHGGGLREVPEAATADLATPLIGRGMAWGDLDGDGDLDLVVAQSRGAPAVFRNDVARTDNRSWIGLSLVQPGSANRDAIGAVVRVPGPGGTQRQTIMPVRSYLSSVPAQAWFGVPDGEGPVEITVRWPDGVEQKHSVLRGKRSTLVRSKS